jgi:CheY-like chemotaxis protein
MSTYKRILLIEDEPDDQEIFLETLDELDPTVGWAIACSGREGLAILTKFHPELPDLIFLDLNIPMIDGTEFLQKIRTEKRYAIYKDIPIVILSSNTNQREKLYGIGATLCIQKPVYKPEYHTLLSTLLNSNLEKDKDALRKKYAGKDNPLTSG